MSENLDIEDLLKPVTQPPFGQRNEGIIKWFEIVDRLNLNQKDYLIETNKKIMPRSVKLWLIHESDRYSPIECVDDGIGNLLSPPKVLVDNKNNIEEVNYETGIINFTIGDAFKIEPDDGFIIYAYEDV